MVTLIQKISNSLYLSSSGSKQPKAFYIYLPLNLFVIVFFLLACIVKVVPELTISTQICSIITKKPWRTLNGLVVSAHLLYSLLRKACCLLQSQHCTYRYRILPNKGTGRSSKVTSDSFDTRLRF